MLNDSCFITRLDVLKMKFINATPSMFAFPDTSSKLTLCRNFMKYSSPNYPSVVSCFKFTTQNHNANTPINYLAQSMFSMFS